ncbi:Clp protease N-terminal domain-containing protein [Spirillospora sp. NPDC029432]|uniref:Clp protease N-terminal domain-containing protein n=1 Tax=Spirillospora sp. NPDC029432 TaxID=3154599 RepID=UPI0034519520
MFERFTKEARNSVVQAQAEARALAHRNIGPEHVLLGLLDGDGPAAHVLRDHGVWPVALRTAVARRSGTGPLDAEALRTLGIDLDAVREAAEETFGEGALDAPAGRFRKGHIPFTKEAKKALELSLRHAVRLKHTRIACGHILLGLLHDGESAPAQILTDMGVNVDGLRGDITRVLDADAA